MLGDLVAQNQAGLVRFDVLKDVAGTVPLNLFRMPADFHLPQQAAHDVSLGEQADQVAIGIHHREASVAELGEQIHRADHRVIGAYRLHRCCHVVADTAGEIALLEGLNQVLDADHADQVPFVQHRHARDALDAQQLFQVTNGQVRSAGDDVFGHHLLDLELVNKLLSPGNVSGRNLVQRSASSRRRPL